MGGDAWEIVTGQPDALPPELDGTSSSLVSRSPRLWRRPTTDPPPLQHRRSPSRPVRSTFPRGGCRPGSGRSLSPSACWREATSARAVEVVPILSLWLDGAALRETLRPEGAQVHGAGLPVGDQLRHRQPYCWRDLKTHPREARHHHAPGQRGRGPDQGPGVGSHVVDARDAAPDPTVRKPWNPLASGLD